MKGGYTAGVGPIRRGWALRVSLLAPILAADYFAGGSLFSYSRTERLVFPLLRWLFHTNDADQLADYHAMLRYTAHYFEYLTIFLLARWLLRLRPLPALIFCVLLAAADEGHQYFLPDRTCSLIDLSFDAAGALTAFAFTMAAQRLHIAPRRIAAAKCQAGG